MSRREGRDSHSRRLHSRSERDQSPNKSRREGKQVTERVYSSAHNSNIDNADQDQKRKRRLPDALPSEVPPETGKKVEPNTVEDGLSRKEDGLSDVKKSSDPKDGPRSRSYFQQNERISAGHSNRSSFRRPSDHGRWNSVKEHSTDKHSEKWKHDGFAKLEADPAPPARKRPAFRERRIEPQQEIDAAGNATEPRMEEKEERLAKPDRYAPRNDERNLQRGRGDNIPRGNYYPSRERFGGGMRGRERFDAARNGERSTYRDGGGFLVEKDKWKHDLFDEANRSPTPKKEDEQIAKIEALLAQ